MKQYYEEKGAIPTNDKGFFAGVIALVVGVVMLILGLFLNKKAKKQNLPKDAKEKKTVAVIMIASLASLIIGAVIVAKKMLKKKVSLPAAPAKVSQLTQVTTSPGGRSTVGLRISTKRPFIPRKNPWGWKPRAHAGKKLRTQAGKAIKVFNLPAMSASALKKMRSAARKAKRKALASRRNRSKRKRWNPLSAARKLFRRKGRMETSWPGSHEIYEMNTYFEDFVTDEGLVVAAEDIYEVYKNSLLDEANSMPDEELYEGISESEELFETKWDDDGYAYLNTDENEEFELISTPADQYAFGIWKGGIGKTFLRKVSGNKFGLTQKMKDEKSGRKLRSKGLFGSFGTGLQASAKGIVSMLIALLIVGIVLVVLWKKYGGTIKQKASAGMSAAKDSTSSLFSK
jgi:hypothetical protein